MPGNPRAKFAITADNQQYKRVLKQSTREAKTFGSSVRSAMKVGAVAGAAAVGGLVFQVSRLTKEAAKNVDTLAKQSDVLGISTKKMAAYQHAARLSGSSNEGFEKGLRKLQKSIVDATNGLTTYTRQFDALELSPEELKNMAPSEQFETVARAMLKVENQTDRVAIAYDLFGSKNVALLNTLALTGENLQKIEADTEAWGVAISRVDAKKIENANDALERAATASQGIGTRIAVAIAPLREDIGNAFADAVAASEGFKDEIEATMKALVIGANFAKNAIAGIQIALLGAQLAALSIKEKFSGQGSEVIPGVDLSRASAEVVAAHDKALAQIRADRNREYNAILADIDATASAINTLINGVQSGDEALAAYAERVKEATALAREQVEQNALALGGASGDVAGDPDATFAMTQEQLQARIEAIRASHLTERELLIEAEDAKFLLLEEAFERELLAFEEKEALKAEITERTNDKILALEQKRQDAAQQIEARHQAQMVGLRQATVDTTIGLLSQLGSRSKTLMKAAILVEKAIAVSRIIINTNAAAARAMAEIPYPANLAAAASVTSWGYGLAAATAALGVAQIASAGGGAGVGGGAGSIGSAGNLESTSQTLDTDFEQVNQVPRQVTTIHIGGSLLAGQDTLDSLKKWIKDLTDADEVIIAGDSRQALEMRGEA